MYNSQNITNELLSKGRNSNTLLIYGISQNPYTKDYIIVIQDEYCEKYGEEYMIFMYCWNKKWFTLKSFNSQNITEEFFNKGNNSEYRDKIYGVS
ncbi:uncharacterized protein OCT59_023494 [Rhizophagus irregularis]|uniref:uncharacterized protein n=1 Tax=Rhizophagus irregularis TaxID=588596 RepID=UPI00333325C1|nr:hypothetical protein OCT59_023494 [Rhizophagus irregularis]